MTEVEKLEIDLEGGNVRATLHKPATGLNGTAVPAVLICRGVHAPGEDANALFDELIAGVGDLGFIAVVFEHRCADLILDEFDAHCAFHDAQDAQAVFGRLLDHPSVDNQRIGVIGYSLGAIAATALARHNPHIARVCLLAATTASQLMDHLTKSSGSIGMVNPDHLPASYVPSLDSIESAEEIVFYDRPTLIVHGAADRFVDPEVSQEYVEALALANRSVEHVLIARANHTFSTAETRGACVEQITRFFAAMAASKSAPAAVAIDS